MNCSGYTAYQGVYIRKRCLVPVQDYRTCQYKIIRSLEFSQFPKQLRQSHINDCVLVSFVFYSFVSDSIFEMEQH